MVRDLRIDEIDRINQWLNYLAHGIENNGLGKESMKDIEYLSNRCFDIVAEAERIEREQVDDDFPPTHKPRFVYGF